MKLRFKLYGGQYVHNHNFNVDNDHETKVIHYNESNKYEKNMEISNIVHKLIERNCNYKIVVDPCNKLCLTMWEV